MLLFLTFDGSQLVPMASTIVKCKLTQVVHVHRKAHQ